MAKQEVSKKPVPTWTVGQEVGLSMSNSRHPNASGRATVVHVGRKWATLDKGYRFDITQSIPVSLDGGEYMSPGSVYPSVEVMRIEHERQRVWMQVTDAVNGCRFMPPRQMTVQQMQDILALLKKD